MANRILRDWTTNDRMNGVSIYVERFFTRLMMKADDFGCFYADTRLLKANLFPLLLDSIREADLSRWVTECQTVGLIVLYESKGKKYLQIQDFRQRLDRMCSKFPKPEDNQVLVSDNQVLREVETNPETRNRNKKPKQETEVKEIPSLEIFLEYAKEKTGNDYISLKKSIEFKYNSWAENSWKTGHGNEIKNWKSTLLNTIPHLKKENHGNTNTTTTIIGEKEYPKSGTW